MTTLPDSNVNPVSRDDQSTDVAIEEQDSTGQTTDSNAPESPPNRRMLDIALHLLSLGFAVFPVYTSRNGVCACGNANCGSIGKHPMTEHGHNDATTDREQVIEWWTQWPDANIGIATGPASGIFVVDLDVKDGVNGLETLRRLEEENGPLPPTLMVRTGSGGRHVIFRLPSNGTAIRNSQGRVGPGIDVRGDGGYIVAVGSMHESGECYGWVEGSSPLEGVTIANSPRWLVVLAIRTPHAAAAAPGVPVTELEDGEAQDIVDTLSPVWMTAINYRHSVSMALAHTMARAGIPPDDIPMIIGAAARNAGDEEEIANGDRSRAARDALEEEQGFGWPFLREHAPRIYEVMRSCDSIQRSVPACILEDLDDDAEIQMVSREEAAIAIREALDTATVELITGISTSSGSGKTTAAENYAIDRQSRGQKTGIVVQNYRLLWPMVSRFEACTVVLSVTSKDRDGAHFCTRSDEVQMLVSSGWNTRKVYCFECPEREDCVAKRGRFGTPGSEIVIGTHQMLREVARLVGPDGVIIVDESAELWRTEVLTREELIRAPGTAAAVLRSSNPFKGNIIRALTELGNWASTHAPGIRNARNLGEILGLSELSLVGLRMDQLMPNTDVDDFVSHAFALGKVLKVVLAAVGNPDMRFEVKEGEEGGLVVYGPHSKMVDALAEVTVPLILMDANLDEGEIRRVTEREVRTIRLYLPDNAPVGRTVVVNWNGSRRYMLYRGGPRWERIVGPIRDAIRRAEQAGARSMLLGTYKPVADAIQELLYGETLPIDRAARTIRDMLFTWMMNRSGDNPRQLFVRYYGYIRGTNEFEDVDMTVSIGDPWINKLDAQRKARWLGVEFADMYRRYTRNELAQFHGRGRAVQRSEPLTCVHYGLVVPGSWTRECRENDNDDSEVGVVINRLPRGTPRVLTPDVVNEIIRLREEGLTGQQIADRLGISLRSVRSAISSLGANITNRTEEEGS